LGSLLCISVFDTGILLSRLHGPRIKREPGQGECGDCDDLSLYDDPFPKTLDGDFRRFYGWDLVGLVVFAYRQYFWRGHASYHGGMESGHIGPVAQRVVLLGFSRLMSPIVLICNKARTIPSRRYL